MKILHLTTFSGRGGAARAAKRLHKGLLSVGINSQCLVRIAGSKQNHSIRTFGSCLHETIAKLRLHLDALPARFYPNRPVSRFSPAIVPDLLHHRVAALGPDLVHLHWLGAGYCKLETLAYLNRPLVWTLHDSWPFTGGCYIPFDCLRYRSSCGNCPVLGSQLEKDLSRKVWKRKNIAWANLDLTVVTPSRWLAECARSSSLFGKKRIEVIPNGLDLLQFKPISKQEARHVLSLPQDKKLILFGAANNTSDRNKGFHLLQPVLHKLAEKGWAERVELLVLGATTCENTPDFKMKTNYFGYVRDDNRLNHLYSAADLFAAPSIQENLSNMVMESLACGTPCIAFNIGGMPDMIDHMATGYLAQPFEFEDLLSGFERLLTADESHQMDMSENARNKVEREYSLDRITLRYTELYREILEQARDDAGRFFSCH